MFCNLRSVSDDDSHVSLTIPLRLNVRTCRLPDAGQHVLERDGGFRPTEPWSIIQSKVVCVSDATKSMIRCFRNGNSAQDGVGVDDGLTVTS
jgi:hypothetical protein